MSKHTPGPWHNTFGTIESADGWHIATVHSYRDEKANARLIAAAPALLEALEALAEHFEYSILSSEECAPFENARAAIAKAKGETE